LGHSVPSPLAICNSNKQVFNGNHLLILWPEK
jgi:hypothetical protein